MLAAESARISAMAWLLYKPEVEVRCPRHGPVLVTPAAQYFLTARG